MKVIENCWDEIGVSDCSFGAYIFENSTAKIYVHDGLDVGPEMGKFFRYVNEDGFAGPCILVFRGVMKFDVTVREYEKKNDKIVWSTPMFSHHEGQAIEGKNTYCLSGALYGFSASVTIEIEAQKFELQIID